MKYLLKKMLRDMKSMLGQFIAIFLMAFIAIFIYSGMEGTWHGMEMGIQKYFDETNIADAWIISGDFTEDQMEKVGQVEGVKSAEGRTVFSATAKEISADSSIEFTSFSTLKSSKPIVTDGEALNEKSQGVWISEEYAEANGLSVGDVLTVELGQGASELKILGTILQSEYVYYLGNGDEILPDYEQYGYAYINEDTLNNKFSFNSINRIYIVYENDVNEKSIEEDIQKELDNQGMIIMDHQQNKSIRGVNDKIQQLYRISLMFSSVFILLALLTMITTMRRIVKTQKIQIGTLKGLGVSNAIIAIHYGLFGFIISFLGVILGMLTGPRFLTPILLSAQLKTYSIPDVTSHITNISVMMSILIVIGCTLATVLASIKGLRGVPSESMRNTTLQHIKSKKSRKPQFFSFEWRWIFRETLNNKVRFSMGIVGVAGCMMLIMATRGLQDSANYANEYLYENVYTYDKKVNIAPNFEPSSIAEDDKGYQMIQEGSIEISKHDNIKLGTVIIVDPGDYINLSDMNNQKISIESNEGIMSHKLSEVLGVEKGDIIQVKDYTMADSLYLKITEISNIPSPQGIFMSKDTWESIGKKFVATAVLCDANSDLSDNTEVINEVKKSTLKEGVNKLLDTFKMIFLLLNIAAITMGIVILYNLGILNYTEKSREYATLKVLGYKSSEIFALSMRESFLTTLIGVIVAIPCGYAFLELYVKTVSVESFEWLIHLETDSFIIALVVTVICSFVINIFVAIKINKINMVDSLKSIE